MTEEQSEALVEELATVVHGALSKANIMAYLDMPLETAGDVTRAILPILTRELAKAKADAEMLAGALKTMIGCTMGGPVAGGDGNTVAIYPPTGMALRKAMDALASFWEKN